MKRQPRSFQPVPIDQFPDVMTLSQICAVLGQSPRYLERFVTLQNKLGEQLLPQEIAGLKHRYLKSDVKRWLKVGIPGRTEKEARVKQEAA